MSKIVNSFSRIAMIDSDGVVIAYVRIESEPEEIALEE